MTMVATEKTEMLVVIEEILTGKNGDGAGRIRNN